MGLIMGFDQLQKGRAPQFPLGLAAVNDYLEEGAMILSRT